MFDLAVLKLQMCSHLCSIDTFNVYYRCTHSAAVAMMTRQINPELNSRATVAKKSIY